MLEPGIPETEHNQQLVIAPDGAIYFPAARLDEHERRTDGYVVVNLVRVGDVGSYEVTVSYDAAGDAARVEKILAVWAGAVGIKRVFFPAGVADLSAVLPAAGGEIVCPACGVHHRDTGIRFMEMVLRHNAFPYKCYICHLTLPQRRPIGYEPEQALMAVAHESMSVDEVLAEQVVR